MKIGDCIRVRGQQKGQRRATYNNDNNVKEKDPPIFPQGDEDKPKRKAIPPDREEVRKYISEQGYSVNADQWFDYYESNGWMVGKTEMKSWQAAIRTWERKNNQNENQRSGQSKQNGQSFIELN